MARKLKYSSNIKDKGLLLDIYKYSQEFEADVATIYMRELGIKNAVLFDVVKRYESFFGNQKRIADLKKLNITDWTEQSFHIGAFCTIVKCNFDFDYALIKLISDYYAEGSLIENVRKYCDVETINDYVRQKFGLENALDDVEKMTTNMFLLHMSLYLQGTIPDNWSKNLPTSMSASIKNNAYIFVDRFMKSDKGKKKKDEDYDDIEQYGVVVVEELTPIQMPNLSLDEIFEGRKSFTKEEWMDLLLRSIGMEPTQLQEREKWHLLERLVPLVENNYNLCELGPRSTGKSHVYKEISPNSILVSGGQTTVANLFYNMGRRQVGLVGHWDCVAFDEVAGISFKDKDGIQIMKDYMNSGSFVRGKDEIAASASMVFVGNINYSVDVLLKTSHLFQPFPELMASDTAFFDRMHYYLPGWEVPKFAPKHFTDNYGFITDYVSEYFRCMRKYAYGDVLDKYFKFGTTLNQRDVMAVRKTVSGLVKLIYPDGECSKEELEEILKYALEGRRRVKEQLKRIGGMEFYAVNFSYIDNDAFEERYVGVPEQGSDKLIPEGTPKPGTVHTVTRAASGMFGVYRIEEESISGNGKFTKVGTVAKSTTDSISNAVNYFKANAQHISSMINMDNTDFMMDIRDLQGQGAAEDLSLATLIGMTSAALKKPVLTQLAVLGGISIGGTINTIEELANVLQVAHDAGANKILLPSNAKKQIVDVPDDLFVTFQIIFYNSPEDAVFKALGIE